jgi:small-conductance mechanosensitive channel
VQKAALAILSAMIGSVALAQQAPVPPAAPATRPAATAPRAAPPAATNGANLWVELRDIQVKLHPAEARIMEKDPEVKALVEKRKALQASLLELDKKRSEKIAEKLAADPATAALEARRRELLKKIAEARGNVAMPAAKAGNVPPAAPGAIRAD